MLRGALFSYRRFVFLPLWAKSRILICIGGAVLAVSAGYSRMHQFHGRGLI